MKELKRRIPWPIADHKTVIVQKRDQTEGIRIWDTFTFRTSGNYEKAFKKTEVTRKESQHYGKPYTHETFIHAFLQCLIKASGSPDRILTVVDMPVHSPGRPLGGSILRFALAGNVCGILLLLPGAHEVPGGVVYEINPDS